MMDWLLILTVTLSGQTETMPVGRMMDQRTCIIAGAGMGVILQRANPGLSVAFTCQKEARA